VVAAGTLLPLKPGVLEAAGIPYQPWMVPSTCSSFSGMLQMPSSFPVVLGPGALGGTLAQTSPWGQPFCSAQRAGSPRLLGWLEQRAFSQRNATVIGEKRGLRSALLCCTLTSAVCCGKQGLGLSLICSVVFSLITKAALISERVQGRVLEV